MNLFSFPMKLIRFGKAGHEKPGVLLADGRRIDVSSVVDDYNEDFFRTDGLYALQEWVATHANGAILVDNSVRLGPPICRPSKIVCIGLNFSDHAAESDMEIPEEPVVFFKATSAISGPNDDVVLPLGSTKTDWEVELAVVVGKRAAQVEPSAAMDYVAGYVLHNDYSERSFQLERGGQWVKGKSCDTFAPLGPFLATSDEIEDVNQLEMWLSVNGEQKQHSSTSNLIFGVADLISYVSQFMSLLPGDIISTGTPAGVAFGEKSPEYLKAGDHVDLGIEGLGESHQRIVASESKAHHQGKI